MIPIQIIILFHARPHELACLKHNLMAPEFLLFNGDEDHVCGGVFLSEKFVKVVITRGFTWEDYTVDCLYWSKVAFSKFIK